MQRKASVWWFFFPQSTYQLALGFESPPAPSAFSNFSSKVYFLKSISTAETLWKRIGLFKPPVTGNLPSDVVSVLTRHSINAHHGHYQQIYHGGFEVKDGSIGVLIPDWSNALRGDSTQTGIDVSEGARYVQHAGRTKATWQLLH